MSAPVLVWPDLAQRRAMRAAERQLFTDPHPSGDAALDGSTPPQCRQLAPPVPDNATLGAGGALFVQALPGTGPGGSIGAVLQVRLKQVERGFTPAEDAKGPDCFLENEAKTWLHRAWLARQNKADRSAALRAARADYAHAAALLLAAIDRIDFLESNGPLQ